MKKRRKIGVMIDKVYLKARYFRKIMQRISEAKRRVKYLNGGYKGSNKEYRDVVVKYWKPYGIRPPKYWYQMFCDGKDAFDPRYIPDTIWNGRIYPYFNDLILGKAYVDKGAYDILFSHLKRPRTIIKNCAGRFYDGNQMLISEEEAISRCCQEEHFVVKFTTNSSGGKNIYVFKKGEVTASEIRRLFKEYRFNFVVQSFVEQHADLAKIHAESLNTMRIMSFFFKGEVHILSAQLRMGSGDARVDNYSSGGFACNINPDGHLSARAVSKKHGWAYEHPCGMRFEDIVVPNYEKVTELVREEHKKLPLLNIIGWDFAMDKDGEPVFIEINMMPESNQNGSGPTFGDMTEEVLRDVFIDKTLEAAFD